MGAINKAKDLIKRADEINTRLTVCNDILDKLDRGVTISVADRYFKPMGDMYAEVSYAIKKIAMRHIEEMACELGELDKDPECEVE